MTSPPAPDPRVAELARAIERLRAQQAPPSGQQREDRPDERLAHVAAVIEQRRRHAQRHPRDVSIESVVASVRRNSERLQRRLGALVGLWEQLLPAEIVEQTRLASLRGGVLVVLVGSSSVGYELDRLLREGVLDALRSRYAGTLVRVNLRVGDVTSADAS